MEYILLKKRGLTVFVTFLLTKRDTSKHVCTIFKRNTFDAYEELIFKERKREESEGADILRENRETSIS